MLDKLAPVTGSAYRLGKAFAISLARMEYSIVLRYNVSEIEVGETKNEIELLKSSPKPLESSPACTGTR